MPRWLIASLAVVGSLAVSMRYVDRPLARAMASFHTFRALLAGTPVELPVMVVLATLAVLLGAAYLMLAKPLPRWVAAGMLAGLALAWSLCLVEFVLKPLFGRTLPSAYLRIGQYGFHWFRSGRAFGSFPSGHADQASAILSVLWVVYPRWRWAYAAAFSALAIALMVGEWHFLSDIVAGGYIGTTAGLVVMRIWNSAAERGDTRKTAQDGST